MRSSRRVFVFSAVLFAWHCTDPIQPLCGCSPPLPPEAVVTGRLLTPADTPATSGLVRTESIGAAPCATAAASQGFLFAPVATGGRFRLVLAVFGGERCYRFYADPAAGSALARSDTQIVSVNFSSYPAVPDSLELTFRLRAP